jgi:NAD(P)H dehydrogenase (quinone)
MNILIIYCHPSRKSYTFQVVEQLKNEFTAQNWNVEISDLYALNFKSDLTEYEREGLAPAEHHIPDDVLEEQKKLKNQIVLFLFLSTTSSFGAHVQLR